MATGTVMWFREDDGCGLIAPDEGDRRYVVHWSAIVVQLIDGQPILSGEKGDHVLKLQEALVALGYDVGKLDGQYGPSTRKAIIAFQKKYKLGADGIVGKKTVKRLNAELKKLAESQS